MNILVGLLMEGESLCPKVLSSNIINTLSIEIVLYDFCKCYLHLICDLKTRMCIVHGKRALHYGLWASLYPRELVKDEVVIL